MGLTVTGVRDVTKMLRELQKRQRTLRPFLTAEAEKLSAVVDAAWAARRSPDGTQWPAYKDGERDGGRLRGAHTTKGRQKRLELRATFIAAFHYFGTEFLPARNPLPFDRIVGGFVPHASWAEAHGERLKAYVLGETDGR